MIEKRAREALGAASRSVVEALTIDCPPPPSNVGYLDVIQRIFSYFLSLLICIVSYLHSCVLIFFLHYQPEKMKTKQGYIVPTKWPQ